MFGIGAL
jgi:signal recognition particle subunit SEC65